MRYAFGKEIVRYVEQDSRIYILACDIGFGVFDELVEKFPGRFINTGIAENATVGIASGMAMQGIIPIVYTITPFLLERPFEVVKLNVCQQKQNVKLVSYGDYPDLGPTHITSDLVGLCACIKLKLYCPTTVEECISNLKQIMSEVTPSFLYLQKSKG